MAAIFVGTASVWARPAVVTGHHTGQAFLTHHRGVCYAVLPNHVARRSRLTLVAGLPEIVGDAMMTPLRFPHSDLALATVRGPLALECGPAWNSLPRTLDGVLHSDATGVLERVRRNGVTERIPVRLASVTYEYVEVDELEGGRIAEGTSGALLTVDDRPIGIVIEAPTSSDARILRMDAIVARLARYIEGRRVARETDADAAAIAEDDAIPFRVTRVNVAPLAPEYSHRNLENASAGQPFIAEPGAGQIELELEFLSDEPLPMQRVTIRSDVSSGGATAPKSLSIEVDASQGERRRPRVFGSGDMDPGGWFVASGGGTFAKRVILKIYSRWEPDLPIRIDEIAVE